LITLISESQKKKSYKTTCLTSDPQSSHLQTSAAILFDSEQSACNSQQCSGGDHLNHARTTIVRKHSIVYSLTLTVVLH